MINNSEKNPSNYSDNKFLDPVGNMVGGTLCIRVGSPSPSTSTLDTSVSELVDNVFGNFFHEYDSEDEVCNMFLFDVAYLSEPKLAFYFILQ